MKANPLTAACLTISAAFSVVMFSGHGVCSEDLAPELQFRFQKIKQEYQFEKWGGQEEIEGVLFHSIPLSASDVAHFGKVKDLTSPSKRNMQLLVHFYSEQGKYEASVSLSVRENTIKAQECLLTRCLYTSAPFRTLKRAEKGGELDFGDVCMLPRKKGLVDTTSPYSRLAFTRNNVVISVSTYSVPIGELFPVLEVARFVDDKLKQAAMELKSESEEQ